MYLSLYLKQLQHEGFSIFIISGTLPENEADQYLRVNPLPSSYFAQTAATSSQNKQITDDDDDDLQKALQKSYLDSLKDEQNQIELAMKMSLEKQ